MMSHFDRIACRAMPRLGRIDESVDGEIAGHCQTLSGVIDHRMSADLGELPAHLKCRWNGARHLLLDKARSVRAFVAMDQSHKLRVHSLQSLAGDHEGERLARLDRPGVGVTVDALCCHGRPSEISLRGDR
jgi:hypothetical protein